MMDLERMERSEERRPLRPCVKGPADQSFTSVNRGFVCSNDDQFSARAGYASGA